MKLLISATLYRNPNSLQ